jgi:hypothetical protein
MMPAADIAALLGGVVRLGLAIVFVQSGLAALRDWDAHVESVRAYRLLPDWLVVAAASCLASLNMAVALLLPLPVTAPMAASAGSSLLLLYALAMQVNVRRGRSHIACGCGGAAGERIGPALVARNAVLAGLLGVASFVPTDFVGGAIGLVAVLGGAASFAALYFAAGQLHANQAAFAAADGRA